jgi:hypothetical protein
VGWEESIGVNRERRDKTKSEEIGIEKGHGFEKEE